MKCFIAFPPAALVLAAARAPSVQRKESRPTPPPRKAEALEIPAQAAEVEPGAFPFTDGDDKTWLYRKTPFGVMRFESKTADLVSPSRDLLDVQAPEDGKTIRFELETRFGGSRWQTKKSQLNEKERAAWGRQLARRNRDEETRRKSEPESEQGSRLKGGPE